MIPGKFGKILFSGFALAIILAFCAAIGGLLGFALPILDVFNHFQPILFIALPLLFAAMSVLVKRQPLRELMLSLCATGFVASSLITVPEIVGSAINTRPAMLGENSFRLMTFNIFAKNRNFTALLDSIESANPDFLLIQEYWRDHRRGLSADIEKTLPYFIYCEGNKRSFLGLYSRYPVSPATGHDCARQIGSDKRHSVISVTVSAPTPFTLATTHFDWPIPAERQKSQMDKVAQSLSTVEGPIILGGDFNSTPFSYAFKNFLAKSNLQRQNWLIPTWPAPPTYPIDVPPWLQLDHILTRGNIETTTPVRGKNAESDHFPLIVDFQVMPPLPEDNSVAQ